MLETGLGTLYSGKILDLDDWGIEFYSDDKDLNPAIISWNDIRKIILADEDKIISKEKNSDKIKVGERIKERAKIF
ncbi:MAG: hypothetical protein O8C66_09540 [Candidatus Methanoperedens sp.]|nr:hypothetical protein [Candidatus Methanoperedens sp.]MCZ7370738.1 hypothetical protein [Candidatus Methanoperedens sp.]